MTFENARILKPSALNKSPGQLQKELRGMREEIESWTIDQ